MGGVLDGSLPSFLSRRKGYTTVLELFFKATLKIRCMQYDRWTVENTLFISYSAGIIGDWQL